MDREATAASSRPGFRRADLFDLAERLNGPESIAELRDMLGDGLKPFGFLGFTLAAVRRVKSIYLHAEITSNWPRAEQTSFQQQHLFNADPVILRSRVADDPFVWDLSIYDHADPIHQQLMALRRKFGVEGGVCIPTPEAWRGRSVLYLSGAGFQADAEALMALRLLAAHAASRAYRLGVAGEKADRFMSGNLETVELSPRERQIFGWLAFGKTSWDVSMIMSISEHTVNEHIASGIGKLRASNRTEAVMRALLTNQIDLS